MVGLGKVYQFRQGVHPGRINAAPGVTEPLNVTSELLFVARPPRTIRRTGRCLSETPIRVNQKQNEADGTNSTYNCGFDVHKTLSRMRSRSEPFQACELRAADVGSSGAGAMFT